MAQRRDTRPKKRFLHAVPPLLLAISTIGAMAWTSSSRAAQAEPAVIDASSDAQTTAGQVVAGDMVVDWVGQAPDGVASLTSGGVPAELTLPPSTDGAAEPDPGLVSEHAAADGDGSGLTEHHDGASGGYALFSTSARWLPGGYVIRLTGADPRIEQYRDELTEAARAATTMTGVPIGVAVGVGGPHDPRRGEIAAVLGAGPCGTGAAGCGGPTLSPTELVQGRVWISPSTLGIPAEQRLNLAGHELGHALGLQHYTGSWTDGRQTMYPVVSGVRPFRAGDGAGLRWMAGASDQPAGAVTGRTYAAGRGIVTGTLRSGTRVRITSGSIQQTVTASSGGFSGSIPLPAGTHTVCATSLDAAAGFRRDLGCGALTAPGEPVGQLDRPSPSFTTIRLSGWAVDPQTAAPVQVQVRRNGALIVTEQAGRPRADMGGISGAYGTEHGFAVDVPATAGSNQLCARVVGVGGGGDRDLGCVVVAHAVDPTGVLESVAAEGLGARVSGWALDPNTGEPISVVIRVDGGAPSVGGTVTASQDRDDVAAAHPAHGPAHGYGKWVPVGAGTHQVCVIAVNVGLGNDRPLGCKDVVVEHPIAGAVSAAPDVVGEVLDLSAGAGTVVRSLVGTLAGPASGLPGR